MLNIRHLSYEAGLYVIVKIFSLYNINCHVCLIARVIVLTLKYSQSCLECSIVL